MEHVGEAVRFYRKRAGITQEQLARRAEIAPTSVVRLETGEVRQPRYGTLVKLAQALQVNPAEFFRFVSDVGKPTALGEGMSVPQPPAYVGDTFSGPFTAVFERDGEWWIGYVEELQEPTPRARAFRSAVRAFARRSRSSLRPTGS